MNERFKELASQAADGMLSYDAEGDWRLNEKEAMKFAELIVRECAKIVEGSSLPDAYSEPCLELIADDIRGHFGVK
jgi:non-homologous end joining protein Ku